MPYVPQDKREMLDPTIDDLHRVLVGLEADDENNNMEGNMNYLITRLIRKVYGLSYTEINSAIGMLQCVILEHYRKVAAPYENQKEFENGTIEADTPVIVTTPMVVEDQSDN